MSRKAVRIGIASFAHYHANFWAEAVIAAPNVDLVGIWDEDTDRGKAAAEKYGTKFFADLEALLERCNGLGITSETSKHAELVEKAATAGVNVLLEKPMARNLEESIRIAQAVEQSKILFMQNFPKRYDPINHELLRILRSEKLGKIALIRIRHGNSHLRELGSKAKDEWYGIPELSGGGALIDEGTHALDMFVWFFGIPEKVYAMVSSDSLGLPVEDTAVIQLRYGSGMLAEISTSNTFVAGQDSVEVYGTDGTAIVRGVDLASRDFAKAPYLRYYIRGNEAGKWTETNVVPQFLLGRFHHQGPELFIKCLSRENESPVVGLEESLLTMSVLDACYRSVNSGAAETILPYPGERKY